MQTIISSEDLSNIIKEKTGHNFKISWIVKPKQIIIFDSFKEAIKDFMTFEDFIYLQYILIHPQHPGLKPYFLELSSLKKKVEKEKNKINPNAFAVHFKNKNEYVPRTNSNFQTGYGTLVVFLDRIS